MNNINAGIIGFPIKHSLSPLIHQYWMKKNNIKGQYLTFDVKQNEISAFIKGAIKKNLVGFNVTIPHKQNIMPFLDEISEEARAIGAVNTVLIKKNKLLGYNTDTYGFVENLNKNIPQWRKKRGSVIILGAGGAARAAVWSLLCNDYADIKIVNRSKDRAIKLISDMKKFFPNSSLICINDYELAIKDAVFLINSTSLGMKSQPPLNIKLEKMKRKAIVYDLVYSPLKTELLLQAEKLHFITVGGLGMLLYQARPAFKMWYGKSVKIDRELKKKVLEQL